MNMKKGMIGILTTFALLVGTSQAGMAAWGTKELETDKMAVTFAREVERGGYKVVSAEELKGWTDAKKPMLIVDTMPYEASYKKQHIPGAAQMEFPIPEMTKLDDKTKASLEKLLGADKNRLIVLYCGFVKCTRSHNAAMWGRQIGIQEYLPLPRRY